MKKQNNNEKIENYKYEIIIKNEVLVRDSKLHTRYFF